MTNTKLGRNTPMERGWSEVICSEVTGLGRKKVIDGVLVGVAGRSCCLTADGAVVLGGGLSLVLCVADFYCYIENK